MLKFLPELLHEIASVKLDECVGPAGKIVRGRDRFVGIMSEKLRRFCVVYRQSADDKDALCSVAHDRLKAIAAKGTGITAEEWAFVQGHYLHHEHAKVVAELFWSAVKMEFPELLVTNRAIGLRENWTVVTYPASQVQVGPPILVRGSDLGKLLEALSGDSSTMSGSLMDAIFGGAFAPRP